MELAQAEVNDLTARQTALEDELKRLLLPRDPNDAKNVFVEIRAGAGGGEAALFAADLVRMYTKYAERQRWKIEVMDASTTGTGGVKDAILFTQGRGAWSRLKFERGVHRVQRVPVTEGSGRIHTSTVTVAVLPEAEDVDVKIDEKDLKVDVYRSSGPGGQGVNPTASALRATHLPTGLALAAPSARPRSIGSPLPGSRPRGSTPSGCSPRCSGSAVSRPAWTSIAHFPRRSPRATRRRSGGARAVSLCSKSSAGRRSAGCGSA